MSLLFLSEDLL